MFECDRPVRNRYLVDYENTHSNGLSGIKDLTENDEVIIFYSSKCDSISFEIMSDIFASEANIITKRVNVGTPNALDFQLVTLIGYLVAKGVSDEWNLYIVSRDHGFDVVTEFWREHKNINIERIPCISGKIEEVNEVVSEAENVKGDPLKTFIVEHLQKKYKSFENVVYDLFVKYDGKDASEFLKALKTAGIKCPNDIKSIFHRLFVKGKIDISRVPKSNTERVGDIIEPKFK